MRTAARLAPAPELSLLALLTLAAVAIRFVGLGAQSYWADEAFSVAYAHLPLHGFVDTFIHGEGNPPLYFVLARLWSKVFGTSEADLRSLSALAGVATVPLAYAACSRISKRAALVAAALVTINPFLVWYSQEARPYALFAALGAAALVCLVRIDGDGGRQSRWLAGWALASALALLTHFFAYPFVFAMAGWLVVKRRDRATLSAVAAVALAALLIAPLALAGRGHVTWVHSHGPLLARLKATPVYFLTGLELGPAPSDLMTRFWPAAVLVCLGIVAACVLPGPRRAAVRMLGLVAATAVPPLAIAALHAGADYFFARYLIVTIVPLLIVIAIGLTRRRLGLVGALLLAALMLSMTLSIATRPGLERANWRSVARSLGAPHGARAVVTRYSWDSAALEPYLPGRIEAAFPGRDPWNRPVSLREVVLISPEPSPSALAEYRRTPLGGVFHLTSARELDGFLVLQYTATRAVEAAPGAVLAAAGRVYGIVPGASPLSYPLLQR